MRAGEGVDLIGLRRRQMRWQTTANSRSDTKVQGDRGELQRGFHGLALSDQGRSVNTHPDIVIPLFGDCLFQLTMGEARPGDAMPVLLELGCRSRHPRSRAKCLARSAVASVTVELALQVLEVHGEGVHASLGQSHQCAVVQLAHPAPRSAEAKHLKGRILPLGASTVAHDQHLRVAP